MMRPMMVVVLPVPAPATAEQRSQSCSNQTEACDFSSAFTQCRASRSQLESSSELISCLKERLQRMRPPQLGAVTEEPASTCNDCGAYTIHKFDEEE